MIKLTFTKQEADALIHCLSDSARELPAQWSVAQDAVTIVVSGEVFDELYQEVRITYNLPDQNWPAAYESMDRKMAAHCPWASAYYDDDGAECGREHYRTEEAARCDYDNMTFLDAALEHEGRIVSRKEKQA